MSKLLSNHNPSQTNINIDNYSNGMIKSIYDGGSTGDRMKRFDDAKYNQNAKTNLYIQSDEFRIPQQKNTRGFN